MQFCSLPVGDPMKGKLDNGVKFASPLNPVTLTDVVSKHMIEQFYQY